MNKLIPLLLAFFYLTNYVYFVRDSYAQNTNKIYKVGVFDDKPLCFKDTDGQLKGIYIDILEHVATQQGWKIDYVYNPSFQSNLENLKKGDIDILVSIGYSEEREKIYDFTGETVLTNWGEVFVHKDSTLRSILNLEGKKVAVMKGNIYYEGSHGLKGTSDQFGIPIEFVETESYEEVMNLIDQEKVDAGLISVLYGDMHKEEHEVEGTPIVFHPIELRFAFTKGNPENKEIRKALDQELALMLKDENSIYYRSQARWLNRTTGSIDYRWLLWAAGGLGSVTLLFVVLSFILRVQVQKRTAQLAQKTIELEEKNEEVQQLNEGLERKVKERTHEVVQQKEVLMEKKKELEHMNKQMRDSITYARNIQEAVLPEESRISNFIPEYFVLSMPRDIVSGDFHWFFHQEEGNKNFLAVSDCTGHGVPGAFMSMLGKSSLDYIIHEKKPQNPAEILYELQADVYRALGTNAKDGMDIAICGFDLLRHKVEFAGAQSSLFLVREGMVQVVKGNKFPIGGSVKYYKKERQYTPHTIELKKGDTVYMSSDGYPDQFGGEENRKYTTRRFKELLTKVYHLPMEQQKETLRNAHIDWKGKNKQIDDILVIGVKVM